jgi:hypothetical protein
MSKDVRRAGMRTDSSGANGPLGLWPDEWANANGRLGNLRNAFGEIKKIGQRIHEINEVQAIAKAANKTAQLPEPDVRAKLAKADQQRLEQLQQRVNAMEQECFKAKLALSPFDYDGSVVDFLKREKLREKFAGMDAKAQEAALKTYAFRRAVLEDRELSPLPPVKFEMIYETELATKFPDIIAEANQVTTAVDIISTGLKTVATAISNELSATGAVPPTVEDKAKDPTNWIP